MAWFFDRAHHRIKKRRQSASAQLILDRLSEYLTNTEEPIKILFGFWDDQQQAISYQELRELVTLGYVDEMTVRLWQQDYSYLVTERLPAVWNRAMIAGSVSQPLMDKVISQFTFDTQRAGALEWVRSRGSFLVTSCTQTQRDAIALLLEDKIRNNYSVDELAKLIRPCIGLTRSQTSAARNFYDTLLKNLTEQHPRTKAETLQARALDKTMKYAERLHRQRALTIAQTEMAYAYNYGADEGIRQAQEDFLIGKCVKKWCSSGDENVCEECDRLDGMEIGMEETFFSGNKVEYDESGLYPPLHPRCACAVEYIEVEPPVGLPRRDLQEAAERDTMQSLTRNADGSYDLTNEPVTDESIANVQLVKPEGWSDEAAAKLQEANQAILAEAKQYPIGTEVSKAVTADFSQASDVIVGTEGEVTIPRMSVPYIGIHNHPDGLPFSPPDIANFIAREDMKILVAVGNNGVVYLMQKTADYDAVGFLDAFKAAKPALKAAEAANDPFAFVDEIIKLLRGEIVHGVRFITGS